jgi:hypothetical protein
MVPKTEKKPILLHEKYGVEVILAPSLLSFRRSGELEGAWEMSVT